MYFFDDSSANAGWPVFPRYFVRGRWLKAALCAEAANIQYLQTERTGHLVTEFARINRPRLAKLHDPPATAKAKALLGYSHRFGSLGYRHLSVEKKTSARTSGIELDEFAWLLSHAAVVDCLTTLVGAIQTGDKRLVSAQLRALGQRNDGQGELVVPVREKAAGGSLQGLGAKPSESQAWDICGQLLNPMLSGRRMLAGAVVQTRIAAPIDLIYWQISDDIENGRYRRCADCLTFFAQTNGRQRYCLPVDGGKESQCAMRDRNKRNRAGVVRERPDIALLRPLLLTEKDGLSITGTIDLET